MVRQLFSPTVRWSDSSIVRHNRNYLTISVARNTRYDYNLTIVEVSQTGHWQQVYMNTLHYDKSWAWCFAVLWWPFWKWRLVEILRCRESIQNNIIYLHANVIPPLYCNHLVRPSVCPSVHTFVTDISASTGRNDFIFDIWLWHDYLYCVSPFQVYRTSTSCLPCDLQMNECGYS